MRPHSPVRPPVALTIAGSDSGGGAGIQADLKTMEAHGVFGTSAVTATTAQNTAGVRDSHVLPVEHVEAQYRAVVEDFDVAAAKTGMLATSEMVSAVTNLLSGFDGPVVVDPVMVATSGDRLLSEDAEEAYEALIAEATLVTPNADEAAVLVGGEVDDPEAAREAGERLVETGVDAALVKGGHLGGERVVDTLVVDADGGPVTHTFEHPRVDTDATHGSGCLLASAIAANLARGESLVEAVEAGTAFAERAVRYGLDVGEGPGSVHHLVALREEAERTAVVESVESIVDALVDRGAAALVRDAGTDVVGATAFADGVDGVAGVEGKIARTRSGIRTNRGVRAGAESDVACRLLAARERFPELRFAADCRLGDRTEAALDRLDWEVVAVDGSADADVGDGVERALAELSAPPAAVLDRRERERDPAIVVFARDAATLRTRLLALHDEIA